jgi:aspartyl/asparaginyl-tRNA synthetase
VKQVILDVLEDVSHGQVNLQSEAAREMIVNLIIASIKSKGCYTEYDDDDKLDTAGHPVKKINKWLTRDIDEVVMIDEYDDSTNDDSTNDDIEYKDIVEDLNESDMEKKMTWEDSIKEEQEARDTWVCEICNKSTYDVEYDYIGSGTNHLNCELKQDD